MYGEKFTSLFLFEPFSTRLHVSRVVSLEKIYVLDLRASVPHSSAAYVSTWTVTMATIRVVTIRIITLTRGMRRSCVSGGNPRNYGSITVSIVYRRLTNMIYERTASILTGLALRARPPPTRVKRQSEQSAAPPIHS